MNKKSIGYNYLQKRLKPKMVESYEAPMAEATSTAPPTPHHHQWQAACFLRSMGHSQDLTFGGTCALQPLDSGHRQVPSVMNTANWRLQASAGWARCSDLFSHTRFATGTIGYQAWQTLALTQASHYFFFSPYEEHMSWKCKIKRFWCILNVFKE